MGGAVVVENVFSWNGIGRLALESMLRRDYPVIQGFILVFATFGNGALSLAVGLAVLFGGTVSAVVGFGLPWLFTSFGSDPALGSGPICTIIQDVSSLSIYFVLVGALIG